MKTAQIGLKMGLKYIYRHPQKSFSTDFGPILDPFLVDTHRPEHPKLQLNRHLAGKKPHLAVRLGYSEGLARGTKKKCPQNHNSVRLARDMVNSQFHTAGHKPSLKGPKSGQQSKHGKKAAHPLPKWTLSMNRGTKPRVRPSQSRWALF